MIIPLSNYVNSLSTLLGDMWRHPVASRIIVHRVYTRRLCASKFHAGKQPERKLFFLAASQLPAVTGCYAINQLLQTNPYINDHCCLEAFLLWASSPLWDFKLNTLFKCPRVDINQSVCESYLISTNFAILPSYGDADKERLETDVCGPSSSYWSREVTSRHGCPPVGHHKQPSRSQRN